MKFWRIKWEKIITPFVAICLIGCLIGNIKKYGFDFQIIGGLFLIYTLLTVGMYVSVYSARKDMLEQ